MLQYHLSARVTYALFCRYHMSKNTNKSLDPIILIRAYTQGIFPMPDEDGTIQWYAPNPRAILEYHNFHISRSLRATINKRLYEIRMDTAFEQVMRGCGEKEETWINEEFIR